MEAASTGTLAPTFALKDTEGKDHSLAEALQQGPVLLAFFKVSCPTCQFTFPFLERLHQAIRGRDRARLWAISQDDASTTREFAREYGCTFPLLLDEDGYPVSNNYGLSTVPSLFLVQPGGEIQLASIGFDRRDLEGIAAEFSRASGGPINLFRPGEPVPDFKPG